MFVRRKVPPRGIPVISIYVCEHCNLNCVSCHTYSPLAKDVFLNIDSFEKDMRRLAELTGEKTPLEAICFMGGEPLLHPEITSILDIARKYFPYSHFWILSNGVRLKEMPDSFWENCHKNNVDVGCSGYPIKLPVEALKEKARLAGVSLFIPPPPHTAPEEKQVSGMTWHKKTVDVNGTQNAKRSFSLCSSNACFALHNGRFSNCPRPFLARHFNQAFGQNLEISKEDYVDIYAIDDIQELLNFRYKPLPFCRYCKTDEEEPRGWGISKKELDEWA
jgi:hypothetical protein